MQDCVLTGLVFPRWQHKSVWQQVYIYVCACFKAGPLQLVAILCQCSCWTQSMLSVCGAQMSFMGLVLHAVTLHQASSKQLPGLGSVILLKSVLTRLVAMHDARQQTPAQLYSQLLWSSLIQCIIKFRQEVMLWNMIQIMRLQLLWTVHPLCLHLMYWHDTIQSIRKAWAIRFERCHEQSVCSIDIECIRGCRVRLQL